MSATGLLVFLLFGFIIGALARWLMPGADPMPWWQTILLGIGGSAVGGWIGQYVHLGIQGAILGVSISSLLLSIAGAMILLLIIRQLR